MNNNKFSEETVKEAWKRSSGKCECEMKNCKHIGKCKKLLLWSSRGKEGVFGWEAHHKNSNGDNSVSNCLILCQPCHKNTHSYGNHN